MHIANTVTENTGSLDNVSWCGKQVPFISSFIHKTIDEALRAAHNRSIDSHLPCRKCLLAVMSKIEKEVHT